MALAEVCLADSPPGTDKRGLEAEALGVLRDSRRVLKPASLSSPLISECGSQDKKFHVAVLMKPQQNADSLTPPKSCGMLTGSQGRHVAGMLSNVKIFHVKGRDGQIYSTRHGCSARWGSRGSKRRDTASAGTRPASARAVDSRVHAKNVRPDQGPGKITARHNE